MAAFDVPNMIPPWLIPTETPGEALAKGIAAGSQIAHNLLASRQLAQQASEFQSKLTLEMQQQDLRTQENRVNMEGRGLGNQLLALKLKDAGEADQQAANWLASYMNRVPTGQEEGTPDPQALPPLPTNLTARAKVLPVLQMDSAKELAGLAATWSAKKGGWQSPESQSEYLQFISEKPWMAGTVEAKKVEGYFDTAGKAAVATATLAANNAEKEKLNTMTAAAAKERTQMTLEAKAKAVAAGTVEDVTDNDGALLYRKVTQPNGHITIQPTANNKMARETELELASLYRRMDFATRESSKLKADTSPNLTEQDKTVKLGDLARDVMRFQSDINKLNEVIKKTPKAGAPSRGQAMTLGDKVAAGNKLWKEHPDWSKAQILEEVNRQ